MAYSELIKNFDNVRSYMREFFVYGFKNREQYDKKSSRSYDNEKRRIESWLGDYMSFRQTQDGKNVFISVDSRSITHNPLYNAFKAKSFTAKDVTLHFYILDMLSDGAALSVREIADRLYADYLSGFENAEPINESTIRNKLKEYTALGILKSSKRGNEIVFSRCSNSTDISSWQDAAAFYSEVNPLGVIGSYILDKFNADTDYFGFKHHYILHAPDTEIVYDIINAIHEKRSIGVVNASIRKGDLRTHTVFPMKIFVSTQTGRQYLLCYHYRFKRPMFFRIDMIQEIIPGDVEKNGKKYISFYEKFRENLWGVSTGVGYSTDHIEMTIHVDDGEYYILDRLNREKRCGRVEQLDRNTLLFTADVYDATEMLTWIRTFIGRIEKLECSNSYVTETFRNDLLLMQKMYGGDGNDIQ